MSRSARLFRLLSAFRILPSPITAARLAEETGVSERTLYRDIDSLRAAGAMIEGAPGLGYTMTEDLALPPQTFDRIELEALVVGLSEIRQRGEPHLADAAASALAKITATLPERQQRQILHATHMVYHYDKASPPPTDISAIRTACWEERALDIRYRDREGTLTQRRIYPLAIVYLQSRTALLAWCCKRQGFRQFMVPGIVTFAATEESFRPRRVSLLRDYVAILSAGSRGGSQSGDTTPAKAPPRA